MIPGWNLTGKKKQYQHSDVIVLSVAKSGRTWLRVLLNKYMAELNQLAFSLDDIGAGDADLPSIVYTHEVWDHFSKANRFQRLAGKYIVPEAVLGTKTVLVLYRDPRDVIVSLYFQKTKRSNRKIDTDLSSFVGNRQFGLSVIVAVLNHWRKRLRHHPNCLWISYEELKADPTQTLSKIVSFLNLGLDREVMAAAVAFADFQNMKKLEISGAFSDAILKPGDPNDPESFKVRKGKVGGYVDYFEPEDLFRLDAAVSQLDPFFKYACP
jgi:hypothetical protein